MKKIIFFAIVFSLILSSFGYSQEKEVKKILIINSFSQNFKWSQDIMTAIDSVFGEDIATYGIDEQIENLNFRQINKNQYKEYFEELRKVFNIKYSNSSFDAIITIDNAAFTFLNDYATDIFEDTPIIFCGLSSLENIKINIKGKYLSGVLDIDVFKQSLDLMTQNFGYDKIYYIADDTLTGKDLENEFLALIKDYQSDNKISFTKINMDELEDFPDAAAEIEQNSAVFLLLFFNDILGNRYDYRYVAKYISENCDVPVFSMWDYYLGYGILGGVVKSGYDQGKIVAEMTIKLLEENETSAGIIKADQSQSRLDYEQLKRFDLLNIKLPFDSSIVNYKSNISNEILILHSYDPDFIWTKNIDKGIKEEIVKHFTNISFYTEYLDLKRNSSPLYVANAFERIYDKFSNRDFKIIIVSDDLAYNFAKENQNLVFNGAPIVFCGVNSIDDEIESNDLNITGIYEKYEVESTLQTAMEIQKNAKFILVINDNTITGKANKKNIQEIEANYPSYKFEYTEDLSMTQLQEVISEKDENTILLLMSFTTDKSNNIYTYAECISMLYPYANTPLYGVWDFYLDEGLIGGKISSGYTQGLKSGELAVRILNGEQASDISPITEQSNKYIFDYNEMKKFGIKENQIPLESIIINKPKQLHELFDENTELFIAICIAIIVLLIILVRQFIIINIKSKIAKKHLKDADTDFLTNILNRRAGLRGIEDVLIQKAYKIITIAFVDVDGLKNVNDEFGHLEGDNLLRTTADILKYHIRSEDILFRYGGDEFVIVFPGKSELQVNQIIERLNVKIEQHNMYMNKGYDIKLTTGLEQCRIKDESIDIMAMIKKADEKMYKNKRKTL